ncbi:MAG: glutamine--tRNA ligase/YqeY domain fusion protein, partial [Deltaproteobacteria bacterium]|nr:glutamine--tRNA ligase/YqeY domain fusion protein [Deltaproteobacteria bacterium]
MTDETLEKTTGDRSDAASSFVRDIVAADVAAGTHGGRVATRFPPEPNGYLHIGHAKSIVLNFGLAREFGGTCNLRFDDTNPAKEDVEYVDSIRTDVRWLGYDWEDREYYASDYFEQLYRWAEHLIREGKAYVCDMTPEEFKAYKGDFHAPGRPSPHRERSTGENLELFRRMRAGEFPDGSRTLRAKIDMAHPNMNMRDPVMYRILRREHHRTGNAWCIYPMYDWAHGQSDALERITHSICTLEFEDHRPLYDWFVENLPVPSRPRQYEFARLNLTYTVMSKRKLLELVTGGRVDGWDDPRMPTISGMRRRGFPPEAIRSFCERIGVARNDQNVDVALLEHCVREQLNAAAPRYMGVLDPLRVVITNFPEGRVETFRAPLDPDAPDGPARDVHLTRELWLEREDFREEAPRKWHRLAPGQEVRLRYACLIACDGVVRDAAGNVVELRCTWDPESRGGASPDGRKVKGTLHWVSAAHAKDAEVRLYDRLFTAENPMGSGDRWMETLNPGSLTVRTGCKVEPALAEAATP